ncbi:MAG: cardiolipin synthase [Gammaproteobacteria bacterium]|nr:cardiolipin synthase [Gammaproteobacteria bacterium]
MEQLLAILASLAILALAVATAGHALLFKRDGRSVILWVGFIILLPLLGAGLYWLVAVNRIRRRASALRPQPAGHGDIVAGNPAQPPNSLRRLATLCDRVSPFPLSDGNTVTPLENGEVAFPAMLNAIEHARHSVALATYIFDDDPLGHRFLEALATASGRGVAVRVLIDAVGQRYSRRRMVPILRSAGVRAAAFMPVRVPRDLASFNLRNHRKLLVIDGETAFTGGMNIRVGHLTATRGVSPIRDLQCRVHGPVVAQLMRVFADDWNFTTSEELSGEKWFPELVTSGEGVPARAIPDGPDEHFEALKLVLQGALAEARRSVTIVTPYFLPDAALISALNTAALRGVAVDILLPARNNLRLVQWASHAQYWQLLERGCRIWHSPPPFDHSKLMLVDDEWVLMGSTNWDPRSLRLNFELNIECYSPALGNTLRDWFERRRAEATEVTLEDLQAQPFAFRLRDSTARLLIPML